LDGAEAKTMTTLVTGAGLIGTEFARCALARGEAIVFVDPEPRADFLRMKLGADGYELARHDVRDLPALVEVAKAHRVDTLVHTAGLIGPRVQQSLNLAFDINLGGTRNVAETMRLSGVRRLVHISTLGVYDRRHAAAASMTSGIAEDFPRGGARGYGNFKGAKELILEAYAAHYGFELIMLRPANVFGLGHYWSGSSGGQKMHNLIEAAFEGRAARIPLPETQAHEYVYAKDVGRAVDRAATLPLPDETIFNIGNGYLTSFEEVLAAVRALFPAMRCEIEAGEQPSSKPAALDISRAKRHLGWEPRFTIASAFADYLEELTAARGAARAGAPHRGRGQPA
jgi:nucleoside-diphosphate-sugar epimerase